MKIIDLLNKIANKENLPKKIYYINREFYLKENTYFGDTFTLMHYIQEEDLNDEVEILEEPRDIEVCGTWITKTEYDKLAHSEEEKKTPKKLGYCKENTFMEQKETTYLSSKERVLLDSNFKELGNKINEIIDYLKSKGE